MDSTSEEAKKEESTSKDNSNDNVVVASSTSDSSLVDNNGLADVNLGDREDLANLLQKCDDEAAEDPNKEQQQKTEKKVTPARQKHRRVLSAVEGSAAQQFLLGELGNNSSADSSDVLGKTVQNSNTTISKIMNSNNSADGVAESNKSSSGLKITDLSQWNTAAQYKADTAQHTVTTGGSINDQPISNNTTTNNNNNIFSVSPMPSLRRSYSPAPVPAPATSTPAGSGSGGGGVTTTQKKYNIQWDPNGDEDDDGLVSGAGSNSNNIDESVLNSIHQQNHHLHHHHHHIPLSSLGTFDASSSVAATAALSSCSQRSIMSQYSTDLEEEEEEKGAQDLFEEEDLIGEFVPDCSDGQTPTRPGSSSKRVGNKSSRSNNTTTNRLSWSSSSSSNPTPTALSSSSPSQARAQQIEHQRRLQQTSFAIAAKRKQMEQQQQQTATDQSILLSSLINHIDTKFQTIQQSQKDYFTRMMTQISLESNKKSQIEHRLHSQLLLQSESMIAMELKILRLEARVEKRERENLLQMQLLQQQAHQAQAQQQQQQQQNKMRFSGGASGSGASGSGFMIGGLSNIGGTTSVGISGSPFVDTKMLGNVEEDMGEEEEEDSSDSENGDNDDYYDDDQDIRTSNRGVGNRKKSSGSRVLRKIVASSAASLVSAVTATSGEGLGLDLGDDDDDLDDVHEDDDSTAASAHSGDSTEPSRVRGVEVEEDNSTIASSLADRMIGRTRGGIGRYNRGIRAVVTGITADDDESTSTPTQSSSRILPTLDSILHNPSVLNNSTSNISSMSESVAISTRAVRSPPVLTGGGAEDENSTLATSVTSATLTSTVYTGNTYPLSRNTATNNLIPGVIGEHVSTDEQAQDHEVIIKDNTNTDAILLNPDNNTGNDDYIRSGSPLTLPSMSGVNSVSAASVISSNTNRTSASALTEVAVASSREFRSSRARARAAAATAATRLQSPPPAEGIPELIVENNSDDINESEDHDTKLQTHQNSNIINNNNNNKNVGDEDDIGNTSRSGSPLTVPSMSGMASVTPSDIQSVGTNFSTVTAVTNQAIAPSRDFRSRRAAAAAQLAASAVNEQQQQQQVTVGVSSTSSVGGGGSVLARPLTNRVVSFINSATARQQQQQQNANVGSADLVTGGGGGLSTSGINLSNTSASMENILEGAQVIFGNSASGSILRGEGDSLTVPDELDNLSVDALFAGASARWREEYEARLDAIQKRLS